MKWFEDMRIDHKLTVAFLFMAVLAAVVGVLGVLNIIWVSSVPDPSALVWRAVIFMGVVVAAAILISLLISRYMARLIGIPVAKLVRVGSLLAVGDICVDTEDVEMIAKLSRRKDGVGKLAKSFQDMISTTREQVSDMRAVAAGDLTTYVDINSENDELGKSLSQLVEQLNSVVRSIAASSDQVASGANLMANSSMALSQGATEQASAVQELTASLEELSAQTGLNARNAETANELAVRARTNAGMGNTQMRDMLKAMEEINESSANINKIIKVIDDIAFQTNILALNAAVEAARAGQHGRGFAVVAEEVRTLASRSASAARETTDMIENSIRKVEAGTKIANETARALSQIVDDVDKAADLVSSIASASQDQASGIEQISQGISQVSQIVQTNAATSEESAAASEELSSQATHLKETVRVFRIKQEEPAAGNSASRG